MKESRERKKNTYKEKEVNLYIFNEKFSMTKKKRSSKFF